MASVNGKAAAAAIAAVLTASGIAAGTVVEFEGWELAGYADPAHGAKLATACAGVTRGVELHRRYSEADCRSRTAQAMIEHGFGIATCLPPELPPNTRAAYTAFAYNVGVGAFCSSTLAKKARAGDLAGSCAELSKWVFAGGKKYRGLERRRAAERALCESGLR